VKCYRGCEIARFNTGIFESHRDVNIANRSLNRSQYPAQFVSGGFVSSIGQPNAMPQPEFDGLLSPPEDRDLDLNPLTNLSIDGLIHFISVTARRPSREREFSHFEITAGGVANLTSN
jgi:hypothetical protein